MRINEIITEAVTDTYLYHGMDYRKALETLYSDVLEARFPNRFPQNTKDTNLDINKHPEYFKNTVKGNSFTRNKRLAWAPVQLTVDRQILAQTNKIIPVDGQRLMHLRNATALHRGGMKNPYSAKQIPTGEKATYPRGINGPVEWEPMGYWKADSDRQRLSTGTAWGTADQIMKGHTYDQFQEEFVIGDIKNIHRSIKRIDLFEPKWDDSMKDRQPEDQTYERLNRIVRMIKSYCGRYNIPFTINNSVRVI
jgi:hypothetical protein